MSDAHIRLLREDIDDWKALMGQLKMDEKDLALIDLQEQREVMKRHTALHKWRRRQGRRATYLSFLNACLALREVGLAERMLDFLNETMKGNHDNRQTPPL